MTKEEMYGDRGERRGVDAACKDGGRARFLCHDPPPHRDAPQEES